MRLLFRNTCVGLDITDPTPWEEEEGGGLFEEGAEMGCRPAHLEPGGSLFGGESGRKQVAQKPGREGVDRKGEL